MNFFQKNNISFSIHLDFVFGESVTSSKTLLDIWSKNFDQNEVWSVISETSDKHFQLAFTFNVMTEN